MCVCVFVAFGSSSLGQVMLIDSVGQTVSVPPEASTMASEIVPLVDEAGSDEATEESEDDEGTEDGVDVHGRFLEELLEQRHPNVAEAERVTRVLLRKSMKDVRGWSVEVFGSRLYGTALPTSDIDLVVLLSSQAFGAPITEQLHGVASRAIAHRIL